eukprot:5226140-Ditylum_brightwellii.AAC.1
MECCRAAQQDIPPVRLSLKSSSNPRYEEILHSGCYMLYLCKVHTLVDSSAEFPWEESGSDNANSKSDNTDNDIDDKERFLMMMKKKHILPAINAVSMITTCIFKEYQKKSSA